MKRLIRKIFPRYAGEKGATTYAQCGEDVIADFLFQMLGLTSITYLDIGAYHPTQFSNTYFFYTRGDKGVCVEPDPFLYENFKKARERDICLNVGVGDSDAGEQDFYVMSSKTLNTFSKDEAEEYERSQSYSAQKIEKVLKIPLVPVNTILEEHFVGTHPNFVSIDTEGFDLAIIRAFDLARFAPEVVCIETIRREKGNTVTKNEGIVAFMKEKGYAVYADTFLNTIFVRKEVWKKHFKGYLADV